MGWEGGGEGGGGGGEGGGGEGGGGGVVVGGAQYCPNNKPYWLFYSEDQLAPLWTRHSAHTRKIKAAIFSRHAEITYQDN